MRTSCAHSVLELKYKSKFFNRNIALLNYVINLKHMIPNVTNKIGKYR